MRAQPADFISPRTLGAKANGEANDTAALQSAIDLAHERGGGTVHLDAGRYLTGTLNWRSNVTIWLDNGATVGPWTGAKDFAEAVHAVLATYQRGRLTLPSSAREPSRDCNRTRSGGPKPIALRKSRRVSIRGITLRSAPSYNISLVGCDYVDIDGVTILNGFSDGIDPDSSRFVRISNCFIESVDDAIALKTTLAERRATEHVTTFFQLRAPAAVSIKCGTESCGDFRNDVFQLHVNRRNGNAAWESRRRALYTVDGGVLEDIVDIEPHHAGRRDSAGDSARQSRSLQIYSGAPGSIGGTGFRTSAPVVQETARSDRRPGWFTGYRRSTADGISDFFDGRAAKTGPEALEAIEKPRAIDPTMFGPLPAYGLVIPSVRKTCCCATFDFRLSG